MSAAPNEQIGGDSGIRCSCGLCIPNFNITIVDLDEQPEITRSQRAAQIAAVRPMSDFDRQFLAEALVH